MAEELVVVKVGGSLFDLADLGPRLRRWLGCLRAARVLLVAGGGLAADVVRTLDRLHGLGEEAAHWLALRSLTVTAHFLHALLPGAPVASDPAAWPGLQNRARLMILDPHDFMRQDEGRPGCLAHCWDVTSDAVAARAADIWRQI